MKATVEGMRSFVLYVSACFDWAATATDPAEKQRYEGLIDLLTPVIKSYCSDRGYEVCVQAIQIYGGYGYTREYPVEQLARDCKITSIYEGTNGIQAMDLLGRKLGMNQGAAFMQLLREIRTTTDTAADTPGLLPLSEWVAAAAARLGEVAMELGKTAMGPNYRSAFAQALPFLDAVGDVIMAWMLLWRATVAAPRLEKLVGGLEGAARADKIAENRNAAFYDGQIRTATFFIRNILPGTLGRMGAIAEADPSAVEMCDAAFGGM
jgi:hypothetical protein